MWELMELLLLGKKAWRWYTGIIIVLGIAAIVYVVVMEQ